MKVYEQILGDDYVCADSQKEAFEWWMEENGKEEYEGLVEQDDFQEIEDSRMEKLTMAIHEDFSEPVSFREVLQSDIDLCKKPPYLFASQNY